MRAGARPRAPRGPGPECEPPAGTLPPPPGRAGGDAGAVSARLAGPGRGPGGPAARPWQVTARARVCPWPWERQQEEGRSVGQGGRKGAGREREGGCGGRMRRTGTEGAAPAAAGLGRPQRPRPPLALAPPAAPPPPRHAGRVEDARPALFPGHLRPQRGGGVGGRWTGTAAASLLQACPPRMGVREGMLFALLPAGEKPGCLPRRCLPFPPCLLPRPAATY